LWQPAPTAKPDRLPLSRKCAKFFFAKCIVPQGIYVQQNTPEPYFRANVPILPYFGAPSLFGEIQ
jgi:hypothetical protein